MKPDVPKMSVDSVLTYKDATAVREATVMSSSSQGAQAQGSPRIRVIPEAPMSPKSKDAVVRKASRISPRSMWREAAREVAERQRRMKQADNFRVLPSSPGGFSEPREYPCPEGRPGRCVVQMPEEGELRRRIARAREHLAEQKAAEAKLAIMFCWLLGMLCLMVMYWAIFAYKPKTTETIHMLQDGQGNQLYVDGKGNHHYVNAQGNEIAVQQDVFTCELS